MPAIDGLRSPSDKTAGGLHHLGRMLDKIRLKLAGRLPEEFQRNYGLSVGLDGQLCGFLGVAFDAVEARVCEGGAEAEIVEWIFARGLRPNRTQAFVWNEHSRKLGWNDRITAYMEKHKQEAGIAPDATRTSFELIDALEGRAAAARPNGP
jgi:hypothetical protein